jgi:hypothetical protein
MIPDTAENKKIIQGALEWLHDARHNEASGVLQIFNETCQKY